MLTSRATTNAARLLARGLCARGTPWLSASSSLQTPASSSSSSSSSSLLLFQRPSSAFSTAAKAAAATPEKMFCRQCEQTQDNYACTGSEGVCGKTAETSACQDVLIHVLKAVSQARVAASSATEDLKAKADEYVIASAFATLTNVNFSEERIAEYIWEGHDLLKQFQTAGVKTQDAFEECKTIQDLESVAKQVSVPFRAQQMNHPDAFSLNETATYGLKGLCAYALHVHQLRQELHKRDPSQAPTLDKDILENIHKIWTKLASNEPDMAGLFSTAMQVGEYNGKVLAALDEAHCELLGTPTPTQVRMTAVEGKCILVSGHDMVDLLHLLEQTEGTGVRVYTHGEMMPAHMYPNLAKFPHLAGNFGTAWQNQVSLCGLRNE
jgi:hydroxylamine reductase